MKIIRSFESRLVWLCLIAALPPLFVTTALFIVTDASPWLTAIIFLVGLSVIFYCAYRTYYLVDYKFKSLANILAAMVAGDFSLRLRADGAIGGLDDLVKLVNGLSQRLADQQREAHESQQLLRTVIEHIDVGIVAADAEGIIQFANPAAKPMINTEIPTKLISALEPCLLLVSGERRVLELNISGRRHRYSIYSDEYREAGIRYRLIFITDVQSLLRSEERQAWMRLVRVISHEINNSLTPIASLSQTLQKGVKANINVSDLNEGLAIIENRARSLGAFIESYKQLAKVPAPQKRPTDIKSLIRKICSLFDDVCFDIQIEFGGSLNIDPIQMEQVLINLIKNAIEADEQKPAHISIKVPKPGHVLEIQIIDNGCGLANEDNIFVPFYTTKENGGGVGLVLCRQITEAHGGNLFLKNRDEQRGCVATITLPDGKMENKNEK